MLTSYTKHIRARGFALKYVFTKFQKPAESKFRFGNLQEYCTCTVILYTFKQKFKSIVIFFFIDFFLFIYLLLLFFFFGNYL